MADGARIAVRRHGDPDARVRVFASNGNGFAIDGYLPFWRLLCPRYDVVVFDMRNHGRNPPSATPNHDYDHMARDMGEIHSGVSGRFGTKPSVGAFHSMSGRAAMKDAVETAWRWDALVLFDPPDIPPEGHELFDMMVSSNTASPTGRSPGPRASPTRPSRRRNTRRAGRPPSGWRGPTG